MNNGTRSKQIFRQKLFRRFMFNARISEPRYEGARMVATGGRLRRRATVPNVNVKLEKAYECGLNLYCSIIL